MHLLRGAAADVEPKRAGGEVPRPEAPVRGAGEDGIPGGGDGDRERRDRALGGESSHEMRRRARAGGGGRGGDRIVVHHAPRADVCDPGRGRGRAPGGDDRAVPRHREGEHLERVGGVLALAPAEDAPGVAEVSGLEARADAGLRHVDPSGGE